MKKLALIAFAVLLLTSCEKEDDSTVIGGAGGTVAGSASSTTQYATETVPDPAGTITLNMQHDYSYYICNSFSIRLNSDNNFSGGYEWGCVGKVGGLGAITTIPNTMGWASEVAATVGNGYIVMGHNYNPYETIRLFVVSMSDSGVQVKYTVMP